MVLFLASLPRFVLNPFSPRKSILSENAVLQKEIEILLRKVGKKRVHFSFYDRFFFVVLNRAADIKDRLTLVKPATVLTWQRTLIRRFWTFEHGPARRGRRPVDSEIKNLILSMRNNNLLWGVKRIQGELLKLDITLSTKTIRKSFSPSGAEGRSTGPSPGRSSWRPRYSRFMRWTSLRSIRCLSYSCRCGCRFKSG